jgi:glycosyltransferase involved in cell wall biosynthesis
VAKFLIIGDPNDLHTAQKIQFLLSQKHALCVLCAPVELDRYQSNNPKFTQVPFIALPFFSWKNILRRRKGEKIISAAIASFLPQVLLILYAEPHVGWAYYRNTWQIPIALFTYGTDALVSLPQITRFTIAGLFRRWLFKKAFHGLDLVMANSQAQIDAIHKLLPADIPKYIVRIAVQTENMNAFLSAPPPRPIEMPYLIFPRMMQPIYQHEKCIEAIQWLPEPIKNNYRFVFIDADGGNAPYLLNIKMLMEKTSKDGFIWLNRLDKQSLWSYLYHADLCIQIPTTDGSSVTALETMYLNTPLLLGTANYDDDLFGHLPRTTTDPKQIAEAITRILESKPAQNEHSVSIQRLADEYVQSRKMEDLLLGLISKQ